MDEFIPIFGILAGIIIPLSAFIWLYYEGKGKREAALAIAKHFNDPSKVEELLGIFGKERRSPQIIVGRECKRFLRVLASIFLDLLL